MPDTIDQATFEELQAAAGEDFVVELVDTFFEEAPQMFVDLRAAHAAGDATNFRRAAHSLKSNANTFGATALAEMARDVELADLPVDITPVDALQAEFERAQDALKRLVSG